MASPRVCFSQLLIVSMLLTLAPAALADEAPLSSEVRKASPTRLEPDPSPVDVSRPLQVLVVGAARLATFNPKLIAEALDNGRLVAAIVSPEDFTFVTRVVQTWMSVYAEENALTGTIVGEIAQAFDEPMNALLQARMCSNSKESAPTGPIV